MSALCVCTHAHRLTLSLSRCRVVSPSPARSYRFLYKGGSGPPSVESVDFQRSSQQQPQTALVQRVSSNIRAVRSASQETSSQSKPPSYNPYLTSTPPPPQNPFPHTKPYYCHSLVRIRVDISARPRCFFRFVFIFVPCRVTRIEGVRVCAFKVRSRRSSRLCVW